jgi:hypothetical protein
MHEDLDRRRKGDAEKLRIALRLRKERTMTLAWIAQRVPMGTRGYLAWLLQGRVETGLPKSRARG